MYKNIAMKKLLYFLAAAVMTVFACTPENNSDDSDNNNNSGGGGGGGVEVVAVTSIQVDIEPNDAGKLIVSYPVNAGRQSIGVSVTPANAVLSQHVSVECKQEGIVNWGYEGGGIYIIPQNEGTATFKLSARSGPAESVEFSVIITEKPAEPESVKISNTGANFQGGELMITEGDTYTIKATVKDDKGNNSPSEPLTWEVVEGKDYLSIDANGKVTAKAISGTTGQIAKVKVTVTSTASSANPLTDEVVVDIAAIAKLTIDRSGSSAGVFSLTAGSSMTLKAKVYNSR